jgi:A/G-specific adenine glycosylase
VGPYTAGAVASICFGLPTPAVDGNVLRVVSRLTDDHAPVTDAAVKKEYAARLGEIYPEGSCGDFTQSLMELGASVCGPNAPPRCEDCPLAALCLANARGTQTQLPVRETKKPRRAEEKTVFLLRCGEKLAVRKRPDRGLLAGLWELPNVPGLLSAQDALVQAEAWGAQPRELISSSDRTHVFTHLTWKSARLRNRLRRRAGLLRLGRRGEISERRRPADGVSDVRGR